MAGHQMVDFRIAVYRTAAALQNLVRRRDYYRMGLLEDTEARTVGASAVGARVITTSLPATLEAAGAATTSLAAIVEVAAAVTTSLDATVKVAEAVTIS